MTYTRTLMCAEELNNRETSIYRMPSSPSMIYYLEYLSLPIVVSLNADFAMMLIMDDDSVVLCSLHTFFYHLSERVV